MLKLILGTGLILLVSTGTLHAATPKYATELEKYVSDEHRSEDLTRLRVSIASDSSRVERAVRIGDVTLCTASSACFKGTTSSFVDVHDTSSGEASTVLDVVIPTSTVTDVYFAEPVSGNGISGHLKLPAPLAIEKGMYGAELFISLKQSMTAGRATYVPVQSAHTFFHTDGQNVHYLPSVRTVVRLPLGAVLTMPVGALETAHIFNVRVKDVGDLYPKISIFPGVTKLMKPITIEASSIAGGTSAREAISPVGVPEEKAIWAGNNSAAGGKVSRVTLNAIGNISPAAFEGATQGQPMLMPGASTNATGKTCAEFLAQPVIIGMIHIASLSTGGARIRACEKIKPNIHMVYVNLSDRRIQFSIPFKQANGKQKDGPYLNLDHITSFANNLPTMAMINGFAWAGDYGFLDNQTGKAMGIIRSAGLELGNNLKGGGAYCKGCPTAADGRQFVMAFGSGNSLPAFFDTNSISILGGYNYNVVSSSTSVVKNGVCQLPGTPSRWSAIGVSNGRMVLVSSTATSLTSAAELCEVFKALAIPNAVRLDGGPSTAMVVSGVLVNELEGVEYFKYGASRHIAYPLRVGY